MFAYTASEDGFARWSEKLAAHDVCEMLKAGNPLGVRRIPPFVRIAAQRGSLLILPVFPRIGDSHIGEGLRHAARFKPSHMVWIAPHVPIAAQEAVRYLNELNLVPQHADKEGVAFRVFQAVERGGRMHLHKATGTQSEDIS